MMLTNHLFWSFNLTVLSCPSPDVSAEPTDQSAQRSAHLHVLEVVRDEDTCWTLVLSSCEAAGKLAVGQEAAALVKCFTLLTRYLSIRKTTKKKNTDIDIRPANICPDGSLGVLVQMCVFCFVVHV